uniref:GNAT family N-acetyltransferase n=1 Tax=Thaumasiovibrio occultus TaxID=1891184 RepID=UPI000B36403B|nr:GNAT family N-acetyltransferase [Thaumasiovibrio occultus]
MDISIELISLDDVDALLDFELANRSWFEQYVPPRDESFYTLQGVRSQISEFLSLYANGEMYPMLIRSNSQEICGRINVHRIEPNVYTGELGYRIGQQFTSKGIASQAVGKLVDYLVSEAQLSTLRAIVLCSNEGSRKVLERNGFSKVKGIANYAELNGEVKDAIEYELSLP